MSKVRNLPEATTVTQDDLLYAVEESAGPNGGRKVKVSTIRTAVELTNAEVKTKYESNSDTNAYTDAEKTKLAGVEAGATAPQDADEVPFDNSDSGLSATEVQSAIDEVNTKAEADFKPSIVSGRILNYTGGTARFDGVFFSVLEGDILLDANVTIGEVYVDLDGLVKQTGSGILAPAYTVVFAKFSTDLNNIISLNDVRVKNSQNIVRGLVADVRDVRAGASASEGSSGRVSDAMHKHNILTGVPSTQTPDQTNAEGSSANLARADHVHYIPAAAPTTTLSPATTNAKGVAATFPLSDHSHAIATGLVGEISTIQPDDAAAAGIVDKFARADHKHAIVASAPTTTLSPATTNAEGSGTAFARNDHTHAIATALVGEITTIQPDDAAAAGTVDKFARADHKHAIVAAAPVTTLAPSVSNAEGSGTSFARNDHTHAIATGLDADVSTILPDDSAATGVSDKFSRAGHKHAIATAAAASQTPDQANAKGVSTSFARADHVHNIPTAAPTDTGTANSQGAAASFAKSDHVHKTVVANQEATATADDTTAQVADTLIVGMTQTPAAGTYLVMWSGSIVNSANGVERTFVSLYSAGAQLADTERGVGTSGGAYAPTSFQKVVTVNGSQAIEVRWRVAGGTSTVRRRTMTLVKLG